MRLKVGLIHYLANTDKQTGLDIELNGRIFRVIIEHEKRQVHLRRKVGRTIEVDFFSEGYITEPVDMGSEERSLPDPTWPSGCIAGTIVSLQPGKDNYKIKAYEEAFDVKMRSYIVMLDTGNMLLEARLGSTEALSIGENIKFHGTLQILEIT